MKLVDDSEINVNESKFVDSYGLLARACRSDVS